MTEAVWLACEESVWLLEFLRGKASERKFRLAAVALCRRIAHLLTDQCCRDAVEVAERFADGEASADQLACSFQVASRIVGWRSAAQAACFAAAPDLCGDPVIGACTRIGLVAMRAASASANKRVSRDNEELDGRIAVSNAYAEQSALLRDIFGNPFRPVLIDPSWLTWQDSTIPKLAQAIYDERRFQDLPILADALEEAGCTSADILDHCRQPGEHVRGCWVVDLLLGKA